MLDVVSKLKNEGVLKLYHEYRTGSFQDLSGNANHGTPAEIYWAGNSLGFNLNGGVVTVADSAELQGTEFTLIVGGYFNEPLGGERLISKRDAGGTNYDMSFSTGPLRISLYDGSTTDHVNYDMTGSRYVAINTASGGSFSAYANGLYIGDSSGSQVITPDDADIKIGNYYNSGLNTRSTLDYVLIVNRLLTETEHAVLYAELSAKKFSSKAYTVAASTPPVDTADSSLLLALDMRAVGGKVKDLTGQGQDGTILNGAYTKQTSLGPCLHFDGIENAVDLTGFITGASDRTVAFWVKATQDKALSYLMDSDSSRLILAWNTSTVGKIGFYDGSWHDVANSPTNNVWHYVVYVFNEELCSIYINGEQVGSATPYNVRSVGGNVAIGSAASFSSDFFPGDIKKVSVYSSAKSSAWILNQYLKSTVTNFKTEYGAKIPINISSAGELLSNTPFVVNTGAFTLREEGSLKVIRCQTNGVLCVESSVFRQEPSESAYGGWKFYFNVTSTSGLIYAMFVSDGVGTYNSPNTNNYHVPLTEAGTVLLRKNTLGSVTQLFASAPGVFDTDEFNQLEIKRDPYGSFYVYLNNELVTTAAGSNPTIDNTHTLSRYICFEMDAGDKIAYSDTKGSYSIVKKVLP